MDKNKEIALKVIGAMADYIKGGEGDTKELQELLLQIGIEQDRYGVTTEDAEFLSQLKEHALWFKCDIIEAEGGQRV